MYWGNERVAVIFSSVQRTLSLKTLTNASTHPSMLCFVKVNLGWLFVSSVQCETKLNRLFMISEKRQIYQVKAKLVLAAPGFLVLAKHCLVFIQVGC